MMTLIEYAKGLPESDPSRQFVEMMAQSDALLQERREPWWRRLLIKIGLAQPRWGLLPGIPFVGIDGDRPPPA